MVSAESVPAQLCKQLTEFGYIKSVTEKSLNEAFKTGLKDSHFTEVVVWLCSELRALYELEESVQPPAGEKPEDIECFLLELSSLLNELECPLDALTCGPLTERFASEENRQKLLFFLINHLKCARLTALEREKRESAQQKKRDEVICVENALKALSSVRPPANLTAEQLFKQMCKMAEERMKKYREKPKLLFTASLNVGQWARLTEINERLVHEYHSRIQLLLKRLDVTIQSFVWSDRIKKLEDKVHEVYRPKRDSIVVSANVDMSDLLAATSKLLVVEKVMSSRQRERTATRLNKVMMTDRPGDRGGRPSELRAPPPEMPAWKKERAPDMPRRGGRGGGYGRNRDEFRSRGGYGTRNAAFENQVRREYETANQRQYGSGHGNQGYEQMGGYGYYDNSQPFGQGEHSYRGRGGHRGGHGGRGYRPY